MGSWIDQELAGCEFADERLGRRFGMLARLGGYLDRTRDPPPDNMVLWRGMARLTDIHLGFSLAKDVGN